MGDKERDGIDGSVSWNRRRVLTATTIGITGLAGCGGSGDDEGNGDADETDELNGSSGTGDSGNGGNGNGGASSGSEDISVDECPMVPGSYTSFDPDGGPIPYSFEYPEAVAPVEYGEQRQTIVSGRFQRTDDLAQEGDITVTAGVNPNPMREGARDSWYEEYSDRETFLTTSIKGSDVQFIAQATGTISTEDQTTHAVIGLAPYNWDNSPDSMLGGITYHEVSMGIRLVLRDDETITSSCVENLLASLEQSVESIEMRDSVSRFEERV